MPIDTRIDGDPESIRRVAGWLKSAVHPAVLSSSTQIHRANSDSEWGWGGDAGDAFRTRMTGGAARVDQMAADALTAGLEFDTFADDMVTARAGMERARRIALDGGLDVIDDQIQDPGPAPVTPQALPSDGSATPAMVQAYQDGVRAQQVHAGQVAAHVAAAQEADYARRVMNEAMNRLRRGAIDEFKTKGWLHAIDFGVNGAATDVVVRRVQSLRQHAEFLLKQRDNFNDHYLRGGGLHNVNAAQHAFDQADDALRRATSLGTRFGGKAPVIGLAITAAGIGVDIASDKPVGKSLISGTAGALAGAGAAALIGGPVSLAVLGAIGTGILVGWGADWAYDELPQGVKDDIENGINAVGATVGSAGSAVGGGAKQVWDSLF